MELSDNHKRIYALKPVIIILFSFLLIMNLANLLFVTIYSTSSFFSETVISHFSIYSSRSLFLVHCALSILTCGAILYLIVKKTESRILPLLFTIYLILFIYPIIAS